MDRKLVIIILFFLIFLAVFIGAMLRAEHQNIQELREEYPELSEEAYSYRMDAFKLWAVRLPLTFLIPLIFLFTGFSQKLSLATRNGRSLFLNGLLFGLVYFGIVYLINLPFSFYGSFILRHRYGLTDQTVLRWLEISAKGFLVNNGILALFLWVPYYLIYRYPETWWIRAGVIAIPVVIFMVFITPMFIDPFFNKYSSLEEGSLRTGIQGILDKGGINEADIFVVDKSRDTKTMNAYMTGILSSRRIVLWDTTINNLNEDEIISITAHEMGHYVKNHIWKSIGMGIGGTFLILLLIHLSSAWIMKASNGYFGFRNLYNYASLPLLLLLLNIFNWFGQPVVNSISRNFEREADRYEISMTEDRISAVTAMEKLYETSLGLPRPSSFYKFWYHTHPSLEERIHFYMTEELQQIGGEDL
jgi:Zn-dependent protease with chaperone function